MGIDGSLKEMEEEMAKRYCPQCGGEVQRNHRGRPKVFCCDECRYKWKNKHQQPLRWASTRTAYCPVCGKEFLASRESPNPRKYCSRACANRGRAKKKKLAAQNGKPAQNEQGKGES